MTANILCVLIDQRKPNFNQIFGSIVVLVPIGTVKQKTFSAHERTLTVVTLNFMVASGDSPPPLNHHIKALIKKRLSWFVFLMLSFMFCHSWIVFPAGAADTCSKFSTSQHHYCQTQIQCYLMFIWLLSLPVSKAQSISWKSGQRSYVSSKPCVSDRVTGVECSTLWG